ncbi:hypothetical protein [Streptomyces longwoodensis]|uniref:hypothetical protein n=1 Tax=Streptomyces longwoodensis TaxID=68231 RepID=UPI0033D30FF3
MTTPPDGVGSAADPTLPGLTTSQASRFRPLDDLVKQLRNDCVALKLETSVPLRVRVALRRRLKLRVWMRVWALVIISLVALGASGLFVAFQWAWLAIMPDTSLVDVLSGDLPEGVKGSPVSEVGTWGLILAGYGLLALVLYGLLELRGKRQVAAGRVHSQLAQIALARRYALVMECAEVIHSCAASRRGGERKPARIKIISKQLKAVRRAVLDAHRSRGSVPLFSNRRQRLKEHQRYVAAGIQEIEARLDRAPDDAVRELAEALLTIADRYCQGRLGELLDQEQLTGVPHQRNWDTLRYLIALTLAGGGITGLAITGSVPESAETYVYGILLISAFVVAFGRNFRRALDVISVISGP